MNSNPLIFRFVANRLRDMSKIALILSFVSVALLGCGGGGGGGTPPVMQTFATGTPTMAERTGNAGNDVFTIAGDITSDSFNLGVIDGRAGSDRVQLNAGAVAASIAFASTAPTDGALHLQNVETITIDGGMVTGDIDASAAAVGVTINLMRGTIGSAIGSDQVDRFVIGSGITFSNSTAIDGGGGMDILTLADDFTPASANLFNNILTLTLSGGGGELEFLLASVENVMIEGLAMMDLGGGTPITPPAPMEPPALTFPTARSGGLPDLFVIANNIVGNDRTHTLDVVIDGLPDGGLDRLQVNAGAVVRNILFSSTAPSGASLGDVHVQNLNIIQINGGTVLGNITGSSRPGFDGDETFTLQSGEIRGNVNGGEGADVFRLFSAIRFTGGANSYIDGQGGEDVLTYNGASATALPNARGGLAADTNTEDGTGSVRNVERFSNRIGVSEVISLSVRNIESLSLSPALNLYGALSDALMQFGQQTAQGFALADLNPQTGRLTQLISKASPFTKGRIWAHKITHSGNGKGSIGLNLTGLTARAASDYDYEMSLTQHGFDAPVVSSQWGAFGLRAVSHTMTGTIETNTAEAQVSGYGAGVSLLWRSRELRSLPRHNLTAHVTALAGGYEVDAYTSPSNPQAVINEVSEGSFSAINAVISAGVADKRELANGLIMRTTADVSWQTLSLDDFTETGADGIIINFDKATRLTARIGAGLESEHWFSDLAFVHETSSGGTLSSGLSQDYRQHDGTAIEMKLGGKVADLAPDLTIKAFAVWRQSVAGLAGEPSAQFELSYRF